MLGAIAGDVIGAPYEGPKIKVKEFPLFGPRSRPTDDSVLTIATAEAMMTDGDYRAAYRRWGQRYPRAGYGSGFKRWLHADEQDAVPYNSFGNGSAMRASPVGWLCDSVEEVLEVAARTAAPTHDHAEGVKGAQAVALAVFLARLGEDKPVIRAEVEERIGYDLGRGVDEIRPGYRFDVTCQGSVPEALIAFLDCVSWEDAVRNAVSLGGDSDTLACIAGAVAEAFYGGVPSAIRLQVESLLPPDMTDVLSRFWAAVAKGI